MIGCGSNFLILLKMEPCVKLRAVKKIGEAYLVKNYFYFHPFCFQRCTNQPPVGTKTTNLAESHAVIIRSAGFKTLHLFFTAEMSFEGADEAR